jgi:hypothetical protein
MLRREFSARPQRTRCEAVWLRAPSIRMDGSSRLFVWVQRALHNRSCQGLQGPRAFAPVAKERSPLSRFLTQSGSLSLLKFERGQGKASGDVPLTSKKLTENCANRRRPEQVELMRRVFEHDHMRVR